MWGGRKWMRDKQNAKLGGVLAGFAEMTGWNVGTVRATFLFAQIPLYPIAWLLWIGYFGTMCWLPTRPIEAQVVRLDQDGNIIQSSATETLAETWRRHRLLEQRMVRIEAYYLDKSRMLARQIDALIPSASKAA